MTKEAQFDAWLKADGPAALVIREPLVPVEGVDGVLFPEIGRASCRERVCLYV